MRALYASAGALVVAGALGNAWAAPQLAGGIGEPRHWWSSIPVGLVALGAALAAIPWLAAHAGRSSTAR